MSRRARSRSDKRDIALDLARMFGHGTDLPEEEVEGELEPRVPVDVAPASPTQTQALENLMSDTNHTPAIGATFKVEGIDYEVLRHDRHHIGWWVCVQRSLRPGYGVATDIGSIQRLTTETLRAGTRFPKRAPV